MASGSTVGQYNFQSWDLRTKHEWMNSGAGVDAATEIQDAVREMGARLARSGGTIGLTLGGAEGTWSGEAARQAGYAMQRGADEVGSVGAAAGDAAGDVAELGDSFATAKNGVPAPNEIPSGFGDSFLYGAAEYASASSFGLFEPQSPVHTAMRARRELDEQANQALRTHMTVSRVAVERMPTVAAPAPMTVAGPVASGPGVHVAPDPSAAAPTMWQSGSAAPTGSQSVGPVQVSSPPVLGQPGTPPPAGPSGGSGGSPVLPPAASTPGASAPGGGSGAIPTRPDTMPPGGASRPGGTTIPGVDYPVPGRPPVPGTGSGSPARGAISGHPVGRGGAGGTGSGGTAPGSPSSGPRTADVSTGRPGSTPGPGSAPASSAMRGGPPMAHAPMAGAAGRGRGDVDSEHRNRFAIPEEFVGDLPATPPSVFGETEYEEANRLAKDRSQP